MTETFGNQLLQFARATNIVPEETFKNTMDTLFLFLSRILDAQVFEILIPEIIGKESGLRTRYQKGARTWSQLIRNSNGDYSGQVSFAYDMKIPLWVIDNKEVGLANSQDYSEIWSEITPSELPEYYDIRVSINTSRPIRTSILIPLITNDSVLGMMTCESPQTIRPTESLKDELKRIASAIASLLDMELYFKRQQYGTQEAIQNLEAVARVSRLPEARVFLAYPSKADTAVVGIIKDELAKMEPRLDVYDWANRREAGSIPKDLSEAIALCQFGVCYLSEPIEKVNQSYQDNSNVLFEAGMLEAIGSNEDREIWLPIREKDSPETPFDFRVNRILQVPRINDEELNEPLFRDLLKSHLSVIRAATQTN